MATRIVVIVDGQKFVKAVEREIPGNRYNRPYVARFTEHGIEFREKGRRKRYLLPYGLAKTRAEWLAAEELKRERAAAKKARRDARKGL